MTTVAQLRKSRQRGVEAGGFKFTIELPTEAVLMPLIVEHGDESLASFLTNIAIVKKSVVGWEGVKEQDILSSGTDDPEPFKPELFAEWIEDRTDLWSPIVEAVFEMRTQKRAEREADSKN